MALKRITTEEFDDAGKLRKRTVVEEDDGVQQVYLVPTYPALPLYPYPAGTVIIPYVSPGTTGPWVEPTPNIITCGISGVTPKPELTASTATNSLVN